MADFSKLKPAGAAQSSLPLTVTSRSESEQLAHDERQLKIRKCARVLFLSYPRADYDDPDGAMETFARVLEDYSDFVIRFATDPKTGIQRKCKFPPRIAELVEFCDHVRDHIDLTALREARAKREQLRIERANLDDPNRPTYAELKAKYGENFGLTVSPVEKHYNEEMAQLAAEREARAKRMYERHCATFGDPLVEDNKRYLERMKALPRRPDYADEGS